jgi:hypothetical protein
MKLSLAIVAVAAIGCTRVNPNAAAFDAGVDLAFLPGEVCVRAGSCGSSGDFVSCTRGSGASCTARYVSADGVSFPCVACTNCQAALAQVKGWCAVPTTNGGTNGGTTGVTNGGTTGGTTGVTTGGTTGVTNGGTTGGTNGGNPDGTCPTAGSQQLCIQCCQDNHPDGFNILASNVESCVCRTPGPCKIQCANDYCKGLSPSTACNACLDGAVKTGGVCELAKECGGDLDCQALVACGATC